MGGVSGGGDDDVVQIQQPNKPGDPFIITVNCPDKTGLACDICRIILDFGLCIAKGGLTLSPLSLNSSFQILFRCFLNLMDPLLNISFRCFNRWRVVLHCVVGYSILRVASYELFLSDSQRTTSENLSALFSLLLRHSATFEIFSCLSVEILLPWPEGLVTR